jgi:single-stranded-DNA-specific exonuclease
MIKPVSLPEKLLKSFRLKNNNMKSEWITPDVNIKEIESVSEITGIDKKIISILYNRGIKDEKAIIEFLYPELNSFHSPFKMFGMNEAVKRLKSAIKKGEKIAVFGDSDLDGITSLTIINNVLVKAGVQPVIRYPRNKEGYGLTCDIINEFIKHGVKLVVTVDSGIRDIEEINYGKQNGIDFIITDHHEPDSLLPDAVIINPKQPQCSYPYKELAGVGVVFKFIQAFLYSYTSVFNKRFVLIYKDNVNYILKYIVNAVETDTITCNNETVINILTENICAEDYIVLTNNESLKISPIIKSIHGTVAVTNLKKIASSFCRKNFEDDKVMLQGLVNDFHINCKDLSYTELYLKLFLELQWRSSRKIISLMEEYAVLVTIGTIADIMPLNGENRQLIKYGLSLINNGKGHKGIQSITDRSNTTAKTISWDIAPLLNAPGRMGETELTVNFFLENDEKKISEILIEIQKLNRSRKRLVIQIIDKIKSDPSCDAILNDNIFFYMHDDIIDGLAGLIANRLAEDLKKPVIIATAADSNGFVKGSGRSPGNFNFFKYITPLTRQFERVGGHAQAFGFTADSSVLRQIVEAINFSIGSDYIAEDSIRIDSIIDLKEIDQSFISSLSVLEPFGKCNEEPVFAAKNVKPGNCTSFGINGNHAKFILANNLHAIGWNLKDKMIEYFNSGRNIDMIFTLENSEYSGKVYPRINVIDLDFSD